MRFSPLLLLLIAAPAVADPAAKPSAPAPAAPAPATAPDPQTVVTQPLPLFEAPKLPPLSLRLEAIRIAGERADSDWRYPDPGDVFGYSGGMWNIGYGHYRPRTGRSAALHGGAIGATILGEILIGSGSPLAGVGALLTGATLDAAAADVDRDAESRKPTR